MKDGFREQRKKGNGMGEGQGGKRQVLCHLSRLVLLDYIHDIAVRFCPFRGT